MSDSRQKLLALEAVAQKIAQTIGPAFDDAEACFALLGFTKGEGGWSTWVSNARREDMIEALREMADSLELDLDHPPGAPGAGYEQ